MTEPVLAPTATKIPADAGKKIVVCGSHGGAYAGYLVIKSGALGFILNDAGGGLDNAGAGSLLLADSLGIGAAVVSADSARIGEADDMLANGILSQVNATARDLGCEPGMACADAACCLAAATPSTTPIPHYSESRFDMGTNPAGLKIICIDSVSLVDRENDGGQIIISGSHGGVVGGRPELALQVDARAGFYNDAGVGKDGAGITRLPALDARNIVAGTVSCDSARIGDGRSTLHDGILSHVNEAARKTGIAVGMRLENAIKVISHAE